MKNVVISGKLHPDAIHTLTQNKNLSVHYQPDCSRDTLFRLITTAEILVTRSETVIDSKLLEQAPNLKTIVRAAVGVGNIDIDFATRKGILVINIPGKNTNSAAELTFGLLLCMLRKLFPAQSSLKASRWDRHLFTGEELKGQKLGLLGLGNVGRRMAQFARAFDMEVTGFDPYISPVVFRENRVKRVDSLEELAESSRILSVHIPLNQETRGLVSADILERLPQDSFLINSARGGVIDEQALLAALDKGKLVAAAIDTWQDEPTPLTALTHHPKVYGTPHIGASTLQAQKAIGLAVVTQIEKYIQGGVVDYPINLPQGSMTDHPVAKSYAVLAEKIGSAMSQMLFFNCCEVTISYRGNLAELDNANLVRLGWMKGFCANRSADYVAYVNAEQIFETLKIKVTEEVDPEFSAYRSALKVTLRDNDSHTLVMGGTVFDNTAPRISLIQGYPFEFKPSGTFLIIINQDKPGVIGGLGSFLAQRGVNIDSFYLSRKSEGGEAMAVVKLDSFPDKRITQEICSIANIKASWVVSL